MVDRSLFLSPDGVTFDGRRAVPNEAVTKLMLELADLKPGEKVLEIGTGSGYQTACLLDTLAAVDTVDPSNESSDSPCGLFNWLLLYPHRGRDLMFSQSDGKLGWPQPKEFDCIFVTCGMTSIPPAYEKQLREGGRLIIPLGKPDGQELLRLEKRNGKLVMGRCAGYVRFQMAT